MKISNFLKSTVLSREASEASKKNLNFIAPFNQWVAPFHQWGSTASRLEPPRGGSLLFTTRLPEIPGAYFINLGRMKRLIRSWSHPVVLKAVPLD